MPQASLEEIKKELEYRGAYILKPEEEKKPRKHFALITACFGEGIISTFKDLGVDYVIEGGQTMNPSSEDFIKAFDKLNADNIIVFPNNKNIIMAAKQASEAYQKAKIIVIETNSIAKCYSALTMMDLSSNDLDAIINDIMMTIDNVVDAEITYSIRDSKINDVEINKDDFNKDLHIDGIEYKKYREYLGRVIVIEFIPEQVYLFKDSPKRRREFLDDEISKMSPSYHYLILFHITFCFFNTITSYQLFNSSIVSFFLF